MFESVALSIMVYTHDFDRNIIYMYLTLIFIMSIIEEKKHERNSAKIMHTVDVDTFELMRLNYCLVIDKFLFAV